MPQDFTECVKNGGKVRTIQLKGGKYMHVCYDKNGSHSGEVKEKKD
jgi:putative hemolysin